MIDLSQGLVKLGLLVLDLPRALEESLGGYREELCLVGRAIGVECGRFLLTCPAQQSVVVPVEYIGPRPKAGSLEGGMPSMLPSEASSSCANSCSTTFEPSAAWRIEDKTLRHRRWLGRTRDSVSAAFATPRVPS